MTVETAAYIRTFYAALKVASEMACQIKHTTQHKQKAAAKLIEAQIDSYLKRVERSFNSRNGKDELLVMNQEFDDTTDFMGVILAMASTVPNDKELQTEISNAFLAICTEKFNNSKLIQ